MKKISFSLLVLACHLSMFSQVFLETLSEGQSEYVLLVQNSKCEGTNCTAIIEYPDWLEINDFSEGVFVGNYSVDEDRNRVLGKARISIINGDSLQVLITLDEPTDRTTADMDLVVIPAEVNINLQNEDILKLINLNINLLDVSEEPIIYNDQWFIDFLEDEDYLINLILGDISYTANAMREQMEDMEVTDGLFKGQMLFDVMEAVNEMQLESFLRYMAVRPLKYMGNDWKISEIYATWVISGTPHSVQDLFVKFTENFEYDKAVFLENYGSLLSKSELDYFRDKANEFYNDGQKETARKLMAFVLELSNEREYTSLQAWSYFTLGGFDEKEDNCTDAIKKYNLAAELFLRSEMGVSAAVSELNRGNCYNLLAKPKKAIPILEESIQTLRFIAQGEQNTNASISFLIGLGLNHLGYSYYLKKDYSKAIANLQDALQLYNASNTKPVKYRSLYARMALSYLGLKNTEMYEHYNQLLQALPE